MALTTVRSRIGSSTPPAKMNAALRLMPKNPKVAINAGTPTRATRNPLINPGISDTTRASVAPTRNDTIGPAYGDTAFMPNAVTTAASPIVNASDKSIPPLMITRVCPAASNSAKLAATAMLFSTNGLLMNDAPNPTRPQISNTNSNRIRNSQGHALLTNPRSRCIPGDGPVRAADCVLTSSIYWPSVAAGDAGELPASHHRLQSSRSTRTPRPPGRRCSPGSSP